jgi:hypothetical protein
VRTLRERGASRRIYNQARQAGNRTARLLFSGRTGVRGRDEESVHDEGHEEHEEGAGWWRVVERHNERCRLGRPVLRKFFAREKARGNDLETIPCGPGTILMMLPGKPSAEYITN